MTIQQAPYDTREAERVAAAVAIGHVLAMAIDIAERSPDGQRILGGAMCAALDTVGGGAPEYHVFGDLRSEAEWWADMATPLEIEAYTAAGLRRLGQETFAQRARKRLFMELWRSFSARERSDFTAWILTKGSEG